MKTIAITLFVLTAVALACKGEDGMGEEAFSAKAQDAEAYTDQFIKNPHLPYDCVEMVSEYKADQFYHVKPTERPANVPQTSVLVRVYKLMGENTWQFCGWSWMDAEQVIFFHQDPDLTSEEI